MISVFPSASISVNIGVERIAWVCPRSTSQATFASSPVTMLSLLVPPSLVTITANSSPSPHLSVAAGVEVTLAEKSPMIEPYVSEPSMSSVATQLTVGESMTPKVETFATLPVPGPPLGEWIGIVPLWVGTREY